MLAMSPAGQFKRRVEEIAGARLSQIPKLIDDFIAGTVEIF